MSENVTRYPLILFRRSRDNHERLRGTAKESASGHLMGDFEAFLVAQCYSVDISKVNDIEFTAVVHDDQVKFLRRVLDVEPVDDSEWPARTSSPVDEYHRSSRRSRVARTCVACVPPSTGASSSATTWTAMRSGSRTTAVGSADLTLHD